MPKGIVETVGAYQYQDLSVSPVQLLVHDRPSVVELTNYVSNLISKGQVSLISAKVPDEATDEEFLKVLRSSNGDNELAVEAYLSELTDAPEKPAPKAKAAAPASKEK